MEIKKVIKQKGWTIEDVAKSMGVNRVTLSQTIGNNPTVKTLQRIAGIIDCKVGDFFKDEITDEPINNTCPYCGKPIKIKIEV